MYTIFYIIDFNSYWVIHHLCIFPYKYVRYKNWPLCKKVKGQTRIIISRNLVVPEYLLHTKFQYHWLFGSRKEDFLRFLPYMVAILDLDPLKELSFPQPTEAPPKIWLQLAQWLLRRCVKMLTDNVRRMPTYTISSPMSLRLMWAKKKTVLKYFPDTDSFLLNPYMTSGPIHPYQLESISNNRGIWCTFSFWEVPESKQCRPWSDAVICNTASDLGLHCLPRSQKLDARH